MAMAVRVPMTATTIISSTRVKPRWLRVRSRLVCHCAIIQPSLRTGAARDVRRGQEQTHLACQRPDLGDRLMINDLGCVRPRVLPVVTLWRSRSDEKRHPSLAAQGTSNLSWDLHPEELEP